VKKRELTEEEKRVLDELEKETAEDKEWKQRKLRFEKLQLKRLSVPEWRILLALAYDGPQNKYGISKAYKNVRVQYATVHRATKRLEKTGWIEVIDTKTSEKNMPTKIYSVTREGLLWLFSKIPKTIHPSLVHPPKDDSLDLRKILNEKDTSKVENLETQNDVYLHLLLDFNIDKIAEKNTKLFPIVFENWNIFKEVGVAQDIAAEFPEVAFSTLVDYYHKYALAIQLETIELLFSYKCFQAFLELYTTGFANVHYDYQNRMINETVQVFKSSPQLHKLFQQMSKDIEDRLDKSLTFIKHVKTEIRRRD